MTTIGDQIIATIVKNNLLHAECTVDRAHPCLVIWSSAAVEQLDALVAEMVRSSSGPNKADSTTCEPS
jgi:hypothetical protein